MGSCRYYRPVDQRAAGAGVFISWSGLPGPALTERCSACEVQKKDKEKSSPISLKYQKYGGVGGRRGEISRTVT